MSEGLISARLQAAFEPHRDSTRAAAMSAYMRNLFPYLGIASPERARIQREALAGLPPPSADEAVAAARELWRLPEREYQYAACALLERAASSLAASDLPAIREFLTTKAWWDTVDTLSSHVVGAMVARHPELGREMDAWIEGGDFWVARGAILHQMRYKQRTDAARLFRYCDRRSGDTEFFIRKAIGWALREYSKTDGDAVREFVGAHEDKLSGLSKREALLWLNGGRKKASKRE